MVILFSKILYCIALFIKGVSYTTIKEFYKWDDFYFPNPLKNYSIKNNQISFGERKFPKQVRNFFYAKFSWFHSFVEKHGLTYEDGKYFIYIKINSDLTYKWRIADTGSLVCFSDVFLQEAYSFKSVEKYVVIDVGTNIGFSLLRFATLENVEYVYGFEPLKSNYQIATSNLEQISSIKDKISNSSFGLGDKDKTLYFSGTVNNSATFSTQGLSEIVDAGNAQTLEIKDAAFALEAIIEKHPGQKLLVKLDCEGAETEILNRWAEENLLNRLHCIILEWHFNNVTPLRDLLIKNGFLVFSEPDNENAGNTGYVRAFRCENKR
jgi:FkbM family methyltransferase